PTTTSFVPICRSGMAPARTSNSRRCRGPTCSGISRASATARVRTSFSHRFPGRCPPASETKSVGFRMLLKRAHELAELQSQHGHALRSVEDLAQLLALWKPGACTKQREEAYFDAHLQVGFSSH